MAVQNQNQKPTHVLVSTELFDLVYQYIIGQPLKEVKELEERLTNEIKLVALPPENEKPKLENNEKNLKHVKKDKDEK